MKRLKLGEIYRLSYNADEGVIRIYFLSQQKGEVTQILCLPKIGCVTATSGRVWKVEALPKLFELLTTDEVVFDKDGVAPSYCLEFHSFQAGVKSHFEMYPSLKFHLKKERE